MVSIGDPFKAIAGWFSSNKSEGEEIITVLQHIAKGNFDYSVTIPDGDKDDERVQILKGLQLTLKELRKLDRKDRRRHAQLIEANKQLRELDRNKREFMELASHQLKTPLAAMQLGLDVLGKQASRWPDEDRRVFDEIKDSYAHLSKLVQSVLEAVRIDERASMKPKCQLTSATYILSLLEKHFRNQFEAKGIDFVIEWPDDAQQLRSDPEFIIEILQNLLENALKYTQAGSVIVKTCETKYSIEFKVVDTGIGIPRDEQTRVFDKLFRAGNVKNLSDVGSGLGLYYTRQLVKRLKGRITFESGEGSGSTFCVRIPRECS